MATYAQLQAESWWNREIVTAELDWLGDELCRRTKRPRAAAGTKGDNHHLSGGHRSQEWILKSRYSTSRTYTVQSGLIAAQTRHVAAFDFTPGSVEQMIAQCRRLIAAMKAGRLDEVRAIYGNVDGNQVVDGWDNVRDRAASSDSSHLWHWHLTLDRRHCANRALMERILAIALGDDQEDDVSAADVWRAEGNAVDGRRQMDEALIGGYNNTVAIRTELAGLRSVVEQLAAAILAGGGSVDTAAILAGVDRSIGAAVAALRTETRDAVADFGEGGAEQVRAG